MAGADPMPDSTADEGAEDRRAMLPECPAAVAGVE